MPISVTFDSNVWEKLVDDGKRRVADREYGELYKLIREGAIQPFFFEGLATIETIRKVDRKKFYSDYKCEFVVGVDGKVTSSGRGTSGPELSPYLIEVIPKALQLGFKFICCPRVGAPSLSIDDEYRAPDDKYAADKRQERTFEALRYIESLGSGRQVLMDSLGKEGDGLVQQTKADSSVSEKKYSKGVAEWVDGDALAASHGYGIEFFCTNDQGSGAGKSSVFHPDNLRRLEKRYPVGVVSPRELLDELAV